MKIFYKSGICIQDDDNDGNSAVTLDPRRRVENGIVSHAHLDHLMPGALMSPQTRDIMGVRKNTTLARTLNFGEEGNLNGFSIMLKDAGHVFGSAMIKVNEALYTGDFNPEGGLTCGKAVPEECEKLIVESTYGKPNLLLPSKEEALSDLLSWIEVETERNPVGVGAYEFGKAQEMIALMNEIDVPVVVTDKIADITDVYAKYGFELEYKRFSEMNEEDKKSPYVLILPKRMLKRNSERTKELKELKRRGGKTCFVSGWCAFYSFTRMLDINAQFPISDHADFNGLLRFIEQCGPKEVYTCHGYAAELAEEVETRLKIDASPLA